MAATSRRTPPGNVAHHVGEAESAIRGIRLFGFKSTRDPIDLSIRPLTIVAGKNSTGKSTAIQPLLLLKQTLEAPHEPDPLLLDGSCVKVHKSEELFWKGRTKSDRSAEWSRVWLF